MNQLEIKTMKTRIDLAYLVYVDTWSELDKFRADLCSCGNVSINRFREMLWAHAIYIPKNRAQDIPVIEVSDADTDADAETGARWRENDEGMSSIANAEFWWDR